MRDLGHTEWLNRHDFISGWGFCARMSLILIVYMCKMPRTVWRERDIRTLRGWTLGDRGGGGYACPEWTVEVLLGSTYADCENAAGDTGEFLGCGCGVLHHLGGVDRDHAP